MDSVDGEQIKQAYLKLPAQERRDVAHWILARELSGRAGASFQAAETKPKKSVFPLKVLFIYAVVLLILAVAIFFGSSWWIVQKKSAQKETELQRAAEEAKRPGAPTNLEFLARNVGKEITIRGVPQDSEVGYLYFSKSRKKALRLNLFVGGVVLLQSGELEDLVRKKQEVEVQGILEKTDDGFYQISLPAQNHLKLLKN